MLTRLYNRLPQRLRQWIDSLLARALKNELFRRIVKNSGYLFSTSSISAALSMLQGILTARLLGVADFGVLGTITMFISVVNKFASFRMSELVVKYVGHYSEIGDTRRAAAIFKLAATVEMLASFFAFGLVALLAPVGARYFAKNESLESLFIFYGLIVLMNLIAESSGGLLQTFDRFKRMAGLTLAQSIATLILIASTLVLGGGLAGVLLAYIVGKTVSALGLTYAALREARQRWGSNWWRTPLNSLGGQYRELARFAISTNISASISLITKDSEVLWVSLLRNPVETGLYKLALALANIVQLPVAPLPQATYPELARQVTHKRWDNMRYIMRQGSRLAGGYTLAATGFLILLGRPLIGLLYGADFLPAYPALLILLVGLFFANTFYWRRPALLALGHPDFPAKINAFLASLKVAATLVFVPVYGYLASAALLSSFYISGSLLQGAKIRSVMKAHESRGLETRNFETRDIEAKDSEASGPEAKQPEANHLSEERPE